MEEQTPVGRLILVPALLTLGVTLLRLAGELMNGTPTLFSRAVGGGAAVVGIIWLVPVFGVRQFPACEEDGAEPRSRWSVERRHHLSPIREAYRALVTWNEPARRA